MASARKKNSGKRRQRNIPKIGHVNKTQGGVTNTNNTSQIASDDAALSNISKVKSGEVGSPSTDENLSNIAEKKHFVDKIFPPMRLWQVCIRELIAIVLWVYVILKLLVFDVDRWVVENYSPSAAWVLEYRFALFVVALGLVAIFWRINFMVQWIAYVMVYPFVILFWHIPKGVIKRKNWTLVVAIAAMIVESFRSFRTNVITISLFTLATIVGLFLTIKWLLISAAIMVSAGLIIMYWRAVAAAFKLPLDAFSDKTLDAIWKLAQAATGDQPDVPMSRMNEEQVDKFISNLQLLVIYNRGCYFLVGKLS